MILLHEKDVEAFRLFMIKTLDGRLENQFRVLAAFDRLIAGTLPDMLRGAGCDIENKPLIPNDIGVRGGVSEDSDKIGSGMKIGMSGVRKSVCFFVKQYYKMFLVKQFETKLPTDTATMEIKL